MPRKTDKRVRLVEAARKLIHQQGFNLTTLADIAQEADVPLGNVYYYFKTKEAIGVAVIESRSQEWNERLAAWTSQSSDHLSRIASLLRHTQEELELIARFGDPVGGLCQELAKQGGPLADLAAKVLHDILAWAQDQFQALGMNRSEEYALTLLSGIQGAYLMANTFKDPELAVRHMKSMEAWLEASTGRKIAQVASESKPVARVQQTEEVIF